MNDELRAENDELRAEVARQTEELNDLDTKLGSALRAIGLEHAENERLRAALDLYADRLNWFRATHVQLDTWPVSVWAWNDQREPWTMALKALDMVAEEREAWKNEAIFLRVGLRETVEAGEAWKSQVERLRAALDPARAAEVAMLFHDTYERLAPTFGYETREETRQFDPTSPNGALMIAVAASVLRELCQT